MINLSSLVCFEIFWLNNLDAKSFNSSSSASTDLLQLVKSMTIFSSFDCNSKFFDELIAKVHTRHYAIGDSIINQGEIAKGMFFLIKGNVRVVSDDREVIFADLNAPAICKLIKNIY